jgi:hypothetical protein
VHDEGGEGVRGGEGVWEGEGEGGKRGGSKIKPPLVHVGFLFWPQGDAGGGKFVPLFCSCKLILSWQVK